LGTLGPANTSSVDTGVIPLEEEVEEEEDDEDDELKI
jgi:hypothetical protein